MKLNAMTLRELVNTYRGGSIAVKNSVMCEFEDRVEWFVNSIDDDPEDALGRLLGYGASNADDVVAVWKILGDNARTVEKALEDARQTGTAEEVAYLEGKNDAIIDIIRDIPEG